MNDQRAKEQKEFISDVRSGVLYRHGLHVEATYLPIPEKPSGVFKDYCYFGASDGDKYILFKSKSNVPLKDAALAIVEAPIEAWSIAFGTASEVFTDYMYTTQP